MHEPLRSVVHRSAVDSLDRAATGSQASSRPESATGAGCSRCASGTADVMLMPEGSRSISGSMFGDRSGGDRRVPAQDTDGDAGGQGPGTELAPHSKIARSRWMRDHGSRRPDSRESHRHSREPLTNADRPDANLRAPYPLINWPNSFSLLLDNGKPMVAFETSDPVTKRKLAIEVKATIQK